jgi:hypothetical protein
LCFLSRLRYSKCSWEPYGNVKGHEVDAFIENQKQKERNKKEEEEDETVTPWIREDWDRMIEKTGGKFALENLQPSTTVYDICDEWVKGSEGMPSIDYLEHRFGLDPNTWLKIVDAPSPGVPEYYRRRAILVEIERLENDEKLSPEEALKKVEDRRVRNGWSIRQLSSVLQKKQKEREVEKKEQK